MILTPETFAGPKGYISGAEGVPRQAPNTGRTTPLVVEVEDCAELGAIAVLALGEGYPALAAEAVRRVGAIRQSLEVDDPREALKLFVFSDLLAAQIVDATRGVPELKVTKRLGANTPVLLERQQSVGRVEVVAGVCGAEEALVQVAAAKSRLPAHWPFTRPVMRKLFHLAA